MRKTNRVIWPLASIVLGFALAVIPTAIAQAQGNRHWVATWMASPMAGTWADEFQEQTLRMIAHVSIGGDRVRVEFSNAFGKQSLTLGAAHVGIQAKDSAIVPGSDRALTFGGSSSVKIPPGALEISDPVDLQVSPLSNLAVSVYVPEKTEPATYHQLGLHTTYISGSGNFTAAEDMPSQWTTTSYYWLTGIGVEADEESGAIVALGDSITDGFQSSVNANMQWPSQLADQLQGNPATANLALVNAGIGGNRILHDVAGPNALERLDRDVIARDGVKYLIVLESINDLGWPHQRGAHGSQEVTAQQLIAGLQQIIERAHAHGIKAFGATLTPYEGASYYSAEGEAKRDALNRWIRTSGAFDGVIDFDAAVRDPNHPQQFLPAYDSGDHLHPNDAGYKAMAAAVPLSLFR
jgi:lysophospholipase L1-like esterase